ncbi:MAG: LysE family translocator [Aggregatilineales bacterium]
MLEIFVTAFVMSFTFALQPGVIMFEAIRRGIPGGWKAALGVEFGSLVGDFTWAILALAGAAILFTNPILTILLGLFGAVLLLRFAWDAWQESHKDLEFDKNEESQHDSRGAFMAGALLSLSNPGNITFWLGMSGVVAGLGFLNPQPIHLVVFLAGFMFAQVIYCFFMAGMIGFGRQFMTPALFRWINRFAALALVYFGIMLLLDTMQRFL